MKTDFYQNLCRLQASDATEDVRFLGRVPPERRTRILTRTTKLFHETVFGQDAKELEASTSIESHVEKNRRGKARALTLLSIASLRPRGLLGVIR
jgi:hypothetical protein